MSLFFILVNVIIIVWILKYGNSFEEKLLLISSCLAFDFFCGVGILSYNGDNFIYGMSGMFFLVCMIVTMYKILHSTVKIRIGSMRSLGVKDALTNNIGIFSILGWVCFACKVIPTLYPVNYYKNIFNYQFIFTGNMFSNVIARNSNTMTWIFDRLQLVLLPCFFILLYRYRKKPVIFISLYLIYFVSDALRLNSTSRSLFITLFIFVFLYLYIEEIISRKILYIVASIAIILFAPFAIYLANLRTGIANVQSIGLWESISALIESEAAGGQAMLDVCSSLNSKISIFLFFYDLFSAPFFFLPDSGFPVLSYLFTESLIGRTYGSIVYYVVLPGSFGEGVILFGKYFPWMYGIVIGLFAGVLFKNLKKINTLKYLYIYYILQFILSFRGSSQSFLLTMVNTFTYFIILVLIFGNVKIKGISFRKESCDEDIAI